MASMSSPLFREHGKHIQSETKRIWQACLVPFIINMASILSPYHDQNSKHTQSTPIARTVKKVLFQANYRRFYSRMERNRIQVVWWMLSNYSRRYKKYSFCCFQKIKFNLIFNKLWNQRLISESSLRHAFTSKPGHTCSRRRLHN